MRKLLAVTVIAGLIISCASDSTVKAPGTTNVPLAMPSPTDSGCAEPYLFTDKNDIVYLSWIDKDSQTSKLMYSSWRDEKWTAPAEIASGNDWFVNWADYPVMATDGGSGFIAHFLQRSDKGKYTYDVKIVTSTDQGKTWTEPSILHDDAKKAEHGFVSTLPYGEHYFITWLDGRNAAMEEGEGHHGGHHGQMTIRAAVVDKNGKKLNEWELDNRVCDCCQTSAAITSNGPVVVYRDRSEDEIRDMSIVRYINGQWTKPQTISADNWKIEGCPVNGPRIVAMENNVAVAWFTSPAKNGQVNAIFSTDGGASFTKPVKINDQQAIGRVDIELLNDKTALVTWMEGAIIKAARVYSDGKKDSSIVIAPSSEARSSGFPQMTKTKNKLFFAWTDDKARTVRMASMSID